MIDLEIKDKRNCMGCHACFNICPQDCISMESDNEGFLYPIVNYNKCIKCGLCVEVCPIINIKEMHKIDVLAYACINKNESIRLNSSSGGIFTLIGEEIIDNGGVVFGARFDNDFSVIHSYVETKEKLMEFRGSKYVQSIIGNTYKDAKEFLDQGRIVLFTGTPCQIAGLKTYLRKDYDKLICQDIICQGVPSPMVWKQYLECRVKNQVKGNNIIDASFRSKDESWKQYKMKIRFESDDFYQEKKDKDNYLRIFMKFLSIRPACFKCKFKEDYRKSDITLADFWGIQDLEPSMDDDKGTSLILINTTKGQELLDTIKDRIIYKEIKLVDAIKNNPMYSKSIPYNDLRNDFFEELASDDFDTIAMKYLKEPMVRVFLNFAKRIYRKLT